MATAGVARGTFYLYFEDKRAIFEEIVDRTFMRLGLAIVRVDPDNAERSVAERSRPVDFPDFTRGRWPERTPLGIVA